MSPRVLIFCDFYLPGFKGGGGAWMIANLIERFAERYDFFIVTRNHDGKGDHRVYDTVRSNEWNKVGRASVFYFAQGTLTVSKAAEIAATVQPSVVYLNSAFSLPARQFLRARRRRALDKIPVVLAPCGEMAEAALSVKPLKKKLFLTLALTSGVYRDVIWKASFNAEADDIRRVIGRSAQILVAPDLAPKEILPDFTDSCKPKKKSGVARFAYLSRIVPNKNLKYLLECLSEVHDGRAELEIIGPIEDASYWSECEALISQLPSNISVSIDGPLPNREAVERLTQSHFFSLPTRNENFGYVLIEALAAGCPLVISDRTEWKDIDERGVGWSIPLEDRHAFTDRLTQCISMEPPEYLEMSRRARLYAEDWLSQTDIEDANAGVLQHAFSRLHTLGPSLL